MIRVDIDPAVLSGDGHPDSEQHIGDAYRTFEAVYDALEGTAPKAGWNAKDITATRARWRAGA